MTGEKIWQLAANKSVKNPSVGHSMNSPAPVELLFQATEPLPMAMPDYAETISLKPGSVLFVPNGYWHTTSSTAASLSLNFTFDQPSWADLVADALRRLLVMDHKWRELATNANLTLDPNLKRIAVDRLKELLKDLPNVAKRLNAAQIVNMLPRPPASEGNVDLRRSWVKTLLGEDPSS
jgi:50S ribosomal protein L16 3-hydroxylase